MGAGKGANKGTHKHGYGKGIVNDPMVGKREGCGCSHRDGADLQCAGAFEKGLTENENQDIDDKGRRAGPIETAIDADEQTEGRLLASASDDITVRLWDVATHKLLATLEGHTDEVWIVAFSPDGQILASSSMDKTVRLWDVASHQLLATLTGHEGSVSGLAFSPDGRLMASASEDKTVRLADLKPLDDLNQSSWRPRIAEAERQYNLDLGEDNALKPRNAPDRRQTSSIVGMAAIR